MFKIDRDSKGKKRAESHIIGERGSNVLREIFVPVNMKCKKRGCGQNLGLNIKDIKER